MEETERLKNKILCLEQLRLSKWQLIWNRGHEIRMLKENDKKEMTRVELEGKTNSASIIQMNQAIDAQIKAKEAEIKYAEIEIGFLDKDIEELKKDPRVC